MNAAISELRSYLPPMIRDLELEAPVRPEDYADREGYDQDFLGLCVEMPLPEDESDLVRPSHERDGHPYELCYEKFSVVMCHSRRLCCVTAVNIDGSQPFFSPKRPGWRKDPRLSAELQVGGDDFYVPTEFDRGHMVRRLDPVWGVEAAALVANKDTHHYTNSCPQVHGFNDGVWGDLEDWILSQGRTRSSQASVFTGPIFQDTDKDHYGGVLVPEMYYKVVVVVDDTTGELSVTAFTMDQSAVMPKVGARLERLFDPGEFTYYQVTLAELQARTGLNFKPLLKHDVLGRLPLPETLGERQPLRLPLASPRSMVLWSR